MIQIGITCPNKSSRRGTPVDTIIIHCTVSRLPSGTIAWLCNSQSKVSYHCVIDDLGALYEVVKPEWQAWHAGVCRMLAGGIMVSNVNSRSIGIGLIHMNDGSAYPEAQLQGLKKAIRHYRDLYPGIRYLKGHFEVAHPVGRKTDPRGLEQWLTNFRTLSGLK